ncbi:phospholipid phosphatase 3-like [Pecten maximus]|uniref:phospholipid phosphatase 3-like n=1 Tax=Pecten maximus TaxID=6579 RepID=UPI001458A8DB|nr:phospholipid phosphatase 3-like [Pecten maximus]
MKVYWKVISDIIIYLAATAFTFLLVFDKIPVIRPYERGFYCDDQSLMYPIVEESIDDGTIIAMSLLIFPAAVIIVELFYACHNGSCSDLSGTLWVYVKNLYRTVGSYLFGGTGTILVVEMLKLFFGRLRPNFIAVCRPNFTAIDCTQGFIREFHCNETDEEVLADLRKSFPSGHSASAAYGMLFLAVYLQFRLLLKWVRLLRPLLQTLVIILGVFICASRLQDYRHHPGDVIGGAIVGSLGCLLTVIFLADKMNYMNRSYLRKMEERNEKRMQMGKYIGNDNLAFRDSVLSINMSQLGVDNGQNRHSGTALP